MNVFIDITDFPDAAGVLFSVSHWNFVLRRKRREKGGVRRKEEAELEKEEK